MIAGGVGASTDGASTDGASTDVFLPGTGQTCTLADLPEQRYSHTLNTLDSTGVLCGGGHRDPRTSCLQFNQTSGVIIITIL